MSIAPPEAMTASECRAELTALSAEMSRLFTEMATARSWGDDAEMTRIGRQMQAIGHRRSPIRTRLHMLAQEEEAQVMAAVIKDMLPAETASAIFREVKRRQKAACAETPLGA